MTVTVPLDREFSSTLTSNNQLFFQPTGGPLQPLRIANGLLPGIVVATAGATPDIGYLFCDGAIYNIADYPDLFVRIGNLYGGNGVTTFAVPDIRGRVIIGRETTLVGRITNAISGFIGTVLGAFGGNETRSASVAGSTSGSLGVSASGTFNGFANGPNDFSGTDTSGGRWTAADATLFAQTAGSVSGSTSGALGVSASGTSLGTQPSIVLNYQISY